VVMHRRQHTVGRERRGNLHGAVPGELHVVDAADNGGGLFVDDPPLGVAGVFCVPVRRGREGLPGVALDLVADAPLLGDITGIMS
jgi:hypothetical protein